MIKAAQQLWRWGALAVLAAGLAGAAPDAAAGRGKVVGLDYFYNHQVRDGKQFHYTLDDTDPNSGFSLFGKVFTDHGATLGRLTTAPTLEDLRKFSIYIIVNPTNVAKATDHKPNYIQPEASAVIAQWVKEGGVLVLMANDKANCELAHFNELAGRFGITFNEDIRNTTPKGDRAHATFSAPQFPDHPLFAGVKMIYMKDICTLAVKEPAKAILTVDKEQGSGKDVIMASADYGKGRVFAVGDPWVYNEYINKSWPGLPVENHKAADNLAQWLLEASAAPQGK